MAMGRGSATIAAVMLLCMFVTIQVEMADAATYIVGGSAGWTFNVSGWPRGKRFKAGDVLVFNYSPAAHNVVSVDRGGYASCRTPKGARVYTSGKDQIKLVKGQNYFICNFPGHCQSGMKIAITAL